MLDCLGQQQTTTLVSPSLIATFNWRGYDVTLQGTLNFRGRTNRAIGPRETAALVELAWLTDELRTTVQGSGHALVHGDFCGWNSGWLADDRLGLWDWEWARLGEPLEDWFHWQTQRLAHFGHGTVADLVNEALAPSSQLRDLCARLGIGIDTAPSSLAASLRAELARLGDATGLQVDLRHEVLEMLQGGVR